MADDQGLGKTISTIALIVTNQRGDDVADEGFVDLDSDTDHDNDADDHADDADADATANAIAAQNAKVDTASVSAQPQSVSAATDA